MGNSSSYKFSSSGIKNNNGKNYNTPSEYVSPGQLRIESHIRRFSQFLQSEASSEQKINGITSEAITKYLCSNNHSLGQCVYNQFSSICKAYSDKSEPPSFLSVEQFVEASNQFISLITDAEQLSFFAKGFGNGSHITRLEVEEFLNASYQLAHLQQPHLCPRVATTVIDSVMHGKESIGVGYLSKWCSQHCSRLVYWMHRHIANLLTSSRDLPQSVMVSGPQENGLHDSVVAKESHGLSPPCAVDANSLCRFPRGSFKRLDEEGGLCRSQSMVPGEVDGLSVFDVANSDRRCSASAVMMSHDIKQLGLSERDEAATDTPVLETMGVKSIIHPSLLWLLTCSLPLLYTKRQRLEDARGTRRPSLPMMTAIHTMLQNTSPKHWELLYISDRDGLGMNRFEHHVFNYRGPTLMILTVEGDDVAFCLALDDEWRDSKNFWGSENSLLLQIRPQFRILERGEKIMYFNLNWRGFPTGIQVGQNYESRALTVCSDLSSMTHHNMPYRVGSVEVWGCGAHQLRVNQQEFKKRLVKDVEMRRKVKLTTSDWQEHPDRYLLQMAGGHDVYAQYDEERPQSNPVSSKSKLDPPELKVDPPESENKDSPESKHDPPS